MMNSELVFDGLATLLYLIAAIGAGRRLLDAGATPVVERRSPAWWGAIAAGILAGGCLLGTMWAWWTGITLLAGWPVMAMPTVGGLCAVVVLWSCYLPEQWRQDRRRDAMHGMG